MNSIFQWRYVFIATLLVSLVHASHAQQINGQVFDYKNRALSLPGASVLIPNSLVGTSTDEEGKFAIAVPDSITKLVVSYVGYVTDTVVIPRNNDHLHIFLKQEKSLNEVVFTQRIKGTEIDMLSALKVEKIGQKELMKAACCNLSESFETTPSIDVAYTDAVSGYKQIQMLGLSGTHTSITRENIPDIHGLAAITGLTYTPGPWIEGMQLSKGTGSVVNGFEGLAGQINVEWRKTFTEEQWHFNVYQNSQGRSEANIVSSHHLNDAISTNTFISGRTQWAKVDQNNDGYLDQPLENQVIAANRWFMLLPKNVEIQLGVKGVYSNAWGGDARASKETPAEIGQPWTYQSGIRRLEAWSKLGKVLGDKPWKSIGWQLSALYHEHDAQYGLRPYLGKQNGLYSNLIYQSIIDNTNHVIKGGVSFQHDDISEQTTSLSLQRQEQVVGAFTEYTYNHLEHFNLVIGLRGDYNNLYGFFLTPRLHMRYSPNKNTAIRASAGRAQRSANVLAENIGLFASARDFFFTSAYTDKLLLRPEVAWNFGINFTQKFRLNYREGSFTTDFYHTRFKDQVIVDIENPHAVSFYNVEGRSTANSFQAQLDYEPIRKWDVRLAYRYYTILIPYKVGVRQKPLIAAHRAFLNMGYEFGKGWKADYTLNVNGPKRVPQSLHHSGLTAGFQSPSFVIMNAQISKSWGKLLDIYLGAENLTNQMQHPMILGADQPYDHGFDASLIWGSPMGRNIYAGLRYTINRKKQEQPTP